MCDTSPTNHEAVGATDIKAFGQFRRLVTALPDHRINSWMRRIVLSGALYHSTQDVSRAGGRNWWRQQQYLIDVCTTNEQVERKKAWLGRSVRRIIEQWPGGYKRSAQMINHRQLSRL